jgi:hypothetical protein
VGFKAITYSLTHVAHEQSNSRAAKWVLQNGIIIHDHCSILTGIIKTDDEGKKRDSNSLSLCFYIDFDSRLPGLNHRNTKKHMQTTHNNYINHQYVNHFVSQKSRKIFHPD